MQMKVKTPAGTISASYLRDTDGSAFGIHTGLYGCDSIVSLEYSKDHGGMVLVISQDALDASGVRFVRA